MAVAKALPQALLLMLDCVTSGAAFPVKVLLVSSTHDFAASPAPNFVADIVADEVAPTGYARQALGFAGGPAIDSNGRAAITWNDTNFGNLGGAVDATVGGAYVYADTGDDATSPLFWSEPGIAPVATDGTAYIVRWTAPSAFVS